MTKKPNPYRPTDDDLARARQTIADAPTDLDNPVVVDPQFVIGYLASCLRAVDEEGAPVDVQVRRARALLAAYDEHRAGRAGGAE